MKRYILTGESANNFMEIKNHNEEKLKERIDSMSKVKVSRDVSRFIDDYARNMSHDEDWKDKLLVDHSITYRRGFDGEFDRVKVLKDITPMQLAEILHNGHEVVEYTVDSLPQRFKFKYDGKEYTAIKDRISITYVLSVCWTDENNEISSAVYDLKSKISAFNSDLWKITKVIDEE